jgi:hypothetical protein
MWSLLFFFAKSSPTTKSLRGANEDTAKIEQLLTIQNEITFPQPHHAIIVAGHAVMRLSKMTIADRSDEGWYLLDYQKNQGFPSIIISHILKGIELLNGDLGSILLFSGGQTRLDVGPTSEGASYYYLAQQMKWITSKNSNRVFLEEFARDSFENLLFSICRFKEVTGVYPTKVTVIGFDFKAERFQDYHRRAIGFPTTNFSYIGIKPDVKLFDHQRAKNGEKAALLSFQKDLYGCNDQTLKLKRNMRNPFHRTIPYPIASPELKELLTWCGPDEFDFTSLPWHTQ